MHRWHQHHHAHLRHLRRRRRLGPLGRFVRARLRRRLFMWMGGTVLFSTLVAGLSMAVLTRFDDSGWRRDYESARLWVGVQFADRWNDPVARSAYAHEASEALGVSLELLGPDGRSLELIGPRCHRGAVDAPVLAKPGGQMLGTVRACWMPRHTTAPWKPLTALLAMVAVFWAATGLIARRIARPLDELARVVTAIGQGDLKARAQRQPHLHDEIGVVTEAVNEMADRIERQLADQKELLAAVSHELRTPLARVRLISELAREAGPTAKTYDDLEREVGEMDALVGELLAKSRVDFGALTLRELDVRQVALEALERAQLSPELLSADESLPHVQGDATLLARALSNLLDNARKHAGGLERIELRHHEGGVALEVLDRGPGLPERGADALFEPFPKGERTREGLGLGLSLVSRIATAHRGKTIARAREGGGAVVGVWLPGDGRVS